MIEAPTRAQESLGPPDGHGPASGSGTVRGGVEANLRRWLWLTVSCLIIAVLAFVDRPGNIIADTKLDLAINPAGFLGRALQLWDPTQFGQLQDQAAGYLFPIGPFFVLGKLMALPPWVVQRLWITAVGLAAFLGVVRLAARLGIGTPATQLAAGFAYALVPRGLTELGLLSGEFLPAAMLPWILLPLVKAVQEGETIGAAGRMRAAARSAVAVALCSGINAASVLVMVICAAMYLLTAPRSARKWRIFAWWIPAVLLATLWWIYPLLLLDKYGVSFLPYTESAAVTTSVTSLSNMLRGTEHWISYLVVDGHPWWPMGFEISTQVIPTILTGLVAGLGLAGLLRRDLPARRQWLWILLLGIVAVGAGYVSGLGNPLAGWLDHLLNGPLAPMRNLRKFDPLIRLPIALGLAHLLARVRVRVTRQAWTATALAAMAVVAIPAFTSGLSASGDFPAIPQYWQQAASWLNKHAGHQAVLEEPGARFGEYIWGRPMDDVLEPLFDGDLVGRQLASVGSVGATRLLDAIDEQMAAGEGSAGISQVLARMGIKYVLVRNDLIRSDLGGAWPARIHQALAESPGIVKVAQFGALPVGSFTPNDAISSFDTPYPPVEIYEVRGAQAPVAVVPATGAMRVYGAPEALIYLADQGLLRGRTALVDSDASSIPARYTVLTDTLRRRVRNFGELRSDYSPTLTASDPGATFEAADDYLEPSWVRFESVARYEGIANVTASSSDADISAIPAQSATGLLPYAAVDGDLRTMWESGALTGPVGQWIRLEFTRPVNPGFISVAFADNPVIGPPVTGVSISTAAGRVTDQVRVFGGYQQLAVAAGPTSWLRLRITKIRPSATPVLGRQVGIAELAVPGVVAARTIVAPSVHLAGGADPSAILLTKVEPQPSGCMLTSLRWVCSPSLVKPTEEQYGFNQSFSVSRAESVRLTGTAIMIAPQSVERYAWIGRSQPKVTASSAYTADPQDQPESAFDANPLTTWVSGGADKSPSLTIRWARARTIREVTITRPPGAAEPTPVVITGSRGQLRGGIVTGWKSTLRFAPMRTSALEFKFTPSVLPVQITDITIPRVKPLAGGGNVRFALPCRLGPRISLDGKLVPTRVTGTLGDLLTGRPLQFAACTDVTIKAGDNWVTEPYWDSFDVQTAVLSRPGGLVSPKTGAVASAGSARVLAWTPAKRLVQVAATAPSYLLVDQNFNSGWTATIGHRTLRAFQLDGWEQAWSLPAGLRGVVTVTFLPGVSYRRDILACLAALGLVIIAAAPRRRRRAAVPNALTDDNGRPPAAPGSPGRWSGLGRTTRYLIGLAVVLLTGLWLGGLPGLLILPAAGLIFLAVLAFAGQTWPGRLMSSPWLVVILLLAASAAQALGVHLRDAGDGSSSVSTLWNTTPQVLCLIVVGRLIASLVMAQPDPADESPGPAAGLAGRPGTVAAIEPLGGPLDDVIAGGGGQDADEGHQDEGD